MRTISLLLILVCSVGAQTPTPASEAIKARMQKFVDDGEIAGAVTLVGGQYAANHFEAVGFADLESKTPMAKDTLFRIASMTKPITAMGVMILVDEGKLKVDDPVEKHLPEFKGQMLLSTSKEKVTPKRPITIKDLMTHTSGLPNYPKEFATVYQKRDRTLTETVAAVAKEPLVFEPGSKWSYCNPGIDTLGRIIEVVSGQPYEKFIQERIFDKLEMKDTTFYPTAEQMKKCAVTYGKTDGKLVPAKNLIVDYAKDAKHPVPAGGLFSTGGDLEKLYSSLMRGTYFGNRQKILKLETFEEMVKTQTGDLKTGFVDGMSFGYGFAVVVEPKGVTEKLGPGTFGHGGAFGTQSWADRKNNKFYILLIQRTGLSNGDASEMRRELQRLGAEMK